MGRAIVKAAPDRDLYLIWSTVVDNAIWVGTRPATQPGHIVAKLLAGFEVHVFGEWRRVLDIHHRGATVTLVLDGASVTVPSNDRIPARLPEGAQ